MNQNYYNSVSKINLQRGGYHLQKIAFFEKELRVYRKSLNNNLTILDIGCNDGELSEIYAKYGKVFGIDINGEAVEVARKKGVDAYCGDALDIRKIFGDQKFDVIIMGDIIEHFFDTDTFLKNVYNVLKKGGLILISTPNIVSLGRRLMSVIGKNPYCEYSAKNDGINVGHIRYYAPADIKTQLGEVNFKKIEISADTVNIPFKFLNKFVTAIFPQFGRELLIKAYK